MVLFFPAFPRLAIGADSPPLAYVADDPVSKALMARLRVLAPSSLNLLLLGETGTGKDVLARLIHSWSDRREQPLVFVNCAGLAEGVLDSELFGHEKGSFTGAGVKRIGLIEKAQGGTLFLDEVGDMPLAVQAKLLRVLEAQRFRRVGSSEEISVNVRIIAATHQDLQGMIEARTFRQDLYYRIAGAAVKVPRLADRLGDLEGLVKLFIRQYAEEKGRHGVAFRPDAMDKLRRYEWPGNIRELRHVIEYNLILHPDVREFAPEQIEFGYYDPTATEVSRQAVVGGPLSLSAVIASHADAVLKSVDGNKSEAARRLGVDRRTLYRLLERRDRFHQDLSQSCGSVLGEPQAETSDPSDT